MPAPAQHDPIMFFVKRAINLSGLHLVLKENPEAENANPHSINLGICTSGYIMSASAGSIHTIRLANRLGYSQPKKVGDVLLDPES